MSKATYNITNDKLLVWFDDRLSDTDYERAKAAKFMWWPGRKCFAAKWSPGAEDFVKSFGIEIQEDDTPDDVESRVERFAGLAAESEQSAASAQKYLESERCNTERRRKNAANGIERGIDEAQHWHRRIEGAISHAAYKERPDVIGRRIKGLEADHRREQKTLDQAVALSMAWDKPDLDMKRALAITNYYDDTSHCFTKDRFPASTYGGSQSLWGALDKGVCTIEQAREIALANHKRTIEITTRWIVHIEDRLVYEKACFFSQGGTEEELHPARSKGKTAFPLLNLEEPVEVHALYSKGGETLELHRMTKAELADVFDDQKGTRVSTCGTFRVRIAIVGDGRIDRRKVKQVFLTDSKKHDKPKPGESVAA